MVIEPNHPCHNSALLHPDTQPATLMAQPKGTLTMAYRFILSISLLFVLGFTAIAADCPNIVFLFADDLGYGDVGAFGQTKIRTPNIDQLAKDGMRLTQCYAGNAVCAPSRCVLMTGLHPGHAQVRNNKEVQPEGQHPL